MKPEYNDVYDAGRRKTGRVHLRGTPWEPGDYGLVVCVWIYDGRGRLLLTRRAPEKCFAGTWENTGGAAQAGETSLEAICRELREETGIEAGPEELEYLDSDIVAPGIYDFYCIRRDIPLEQVVLQPGETDDVRWASFDQVHRLIREGKICDAIAKQFIRQEPLLLRRQNRT